MSLWDDISTEQLVQQATQSQQHSKQSQWADEDVEDETDERSNFASAIPSQPRNPNKVKTQPNQQKQKKTNTKSSNQSSSGEAEVEQDNSAEAMARRKAVEIERERQRDAELTGDLFGLDIGNNKQSAAAQHRAEMAKLVAAEAGQIAPNSNSTQSSKSNFSQHSKHSSISNSSIENISLDTEEDFDRLAAVLNKRINDIATECSDKKKVGIRLAKFIKTLSTGSAASSILTSDQWNDLKRVITLKHTESTQRSKQQQHKSVATKKSTAVKNIPSTTSRGRNIVGFEDLQDDDNDDYLRAGDDYDFC